MTRITIKLPSDRKRWGNLAFLDDSGATLAGPFPVLGKSTGRRYKALVNPDTNPMNQCGDTPTGTYRIDGFIPTGGLQFTRKTYGENYVIQMTPTAGMALAAADPARPFDQRRGVIHIHAGRVKPDAVESLGWTQGCLRVHEDTLKRLCDAILNATPPTLCEIVEVSDDALDPHLQGASHDLVYLDENDPPPTAEDEEPLRNAPMLRHIGALPNWQGEIIDNRPCGEGTYHYPNGDTYTGTWSFTRPYGTGTHRYANGDRYVSRYFPEFYGGTYYFSNGDVLYGGSVDGARLYDVKLVYANGDVYTGSVLHGKPDGDGTLTHPDGTEETGRFLQGVLQHP